MIRCAMIGVAILGATVSVLPAQGHVLDLGETKLHYVAAGSGQAVILIHGWALNLREWDEQIEAFSPQFRVVAYDRRGNGRSTGFPDVSADAGDLHDLLDSLGIGRAVLVGHSAGGNVARRFAAAFPDRVAGLVLYPAGGRPPGFELPPGVPRPPLAELVAIARAHGVDSVFRFIESLPEFQRKPNRRPEIVARLDTILRSYTGRDLLESRPPSGRFPSPSLEVMKQWTFPVLFLVGDSEGAMQQHLSDSLARVMPNARKVVIPGGGHGVHFDEPERFNEALLAFLREVGRRTTSP